MKPVKGQHVRPKSLSSGIDPQAQRDAISAARKAGIFDASAHLAYSPMGKAVASGFPLPRR